MMDCPESPSSGKKKDVAVNNDVISFLLLPLPLPLVALSLPVHDYMHPATRSMHDRKKRSLQDYYYYYYYCKV